MNSAIDDAQRQLAQKAARITQLETSQNELQAQLAMAQESAHERDSPQEQLSVQKTDAANLREELRARTGFSAQHGDSEPEERG